MNVFCGTPKFDIYCKLVTTETMKVECRRCGEALLFPYAGDWKAACEIIQKWTDIHKGQNPDNLKQKKKEHVLPIADELRKLNPQLYHTHCWYCGIELLGRRPRTPQSSTSDHVIPRSRGGAQANKNIVPACFACNQSKKDMLVEEFRILVFGDTKAQFWGEKMVCELRETKSESETRTLENEL